MSGPLVYTVRKRCYLCGAEWDGHAFTPQPEGAAPLPAMCIECGAKEEAELERIRTQGPVTESGRPLPKEPAVEPDDRHDRIAP